VILDVFVGHVEQECRHLVTMLPTEAAVKKLKTHLENTSLETPIWQECLIKGNVKSKLGTTSNIDVNAFPVDVLASFNDVGSFAGKIAADSASKEESDILPMRKARNCVEPKISLHGVFGSVYKVTCGEEFLDRPEFEAESTG